MKSEWIDVSIPLKDGMVHWPDDPPVKIRNAKDMEKGDPATVSLISMGSHTGTHMDAPAHFIQKGKSIDEMPFEATVGPARVIEIKDRESIKPEELRIHKIKSGERILFKTANSSRCWKNEEFVRDFVYISKEAAAELGKIKIRCAGVDYLSVGGYYRDGVETHRNLLSAEIWIIEGLNLLNVEAGNYELLCLPLKMLRGDGAPARAILRPIR